VADGELVPHQVEVVDAHLAALLPPQSRPVKHTDHQPIKAVASFDRVEDVAHFLGG
jgi:hypothetical protein